MRISSYWLRRQIAGGLVVFLVAPLSEAVAVLPQQGPSGQQMESVSSDKNQPRDQGSQSKEPVTETTQAETSNPDNQIQTSSQDANQAGQPSAPQSASEQKQSEAPKPVGTAAAPYEKTTGVAASRPAGAAIAPAKQRRARSILIKVGVVVAAAVAVGTVVALSHGSPSRP
jgi:hypothetical protein